MVAWIENQGGEVEKSDSVDDLNPMVVKKCRYGMMMYNKWDQYVGRALDLYGEFSESEVDFFRAAIRPGMTVIDVGANIGCHSIAFGHFVGSGGQVIAVEPQRRVYQILVGNVALSNLSNIDVLHGALGAEEGILHVPAMNYEAEGNFGGVSLIESAHGSSEEVKVAALDSLDLQSCHFIKIDVEGAETLVIKGARQTIRTHSPIIYAENDRPAGSKELLSLLFEFDYRLYWHTPEMFNPKNFLGNQGNVFGSTVSLNVIALPSAMPQNLDGLREIKEADEWPWTLDHR